jgi:hypothetical protein
MKATFVLISFALLYVHVARGMPTDAKADEKVKATNADQAPQAAPADKPETCKANINGQEQTLNTGDRYCLDDNTHRVCNYGEWIDNPCDPGSKCLKSPSSWQVLCRIVNRNPPQVIPQDAQNDNAAKSSPDAPSVPAPAAKPEEKPQPSPAAEPEKPSNPAPPPPKTEEPKPAPKTEEPKPAPTHEEPKTPTADKPAPTPQADTKPETCKATIDGQEQTLQPGDRYCSSDNTNRVCNWGEFVDFECPTGSKCLKSPDKWQVLCRVINKNPKAQGGSE